MMKRFSCIRVGLFSAVMIWMTGCSGTPIVQGPPMGVWTLSEGVQSPESAYYDADSGYVFVSQIGDGGGMAKDGDGVISKLSLDGRMIERNWVTGLNAPKGLRSHGGTLWVTDIDRIVGIEIATGRVMHDLPVPGAVFLNDLACGPDGSVYVADMLPSRVHRYIDGRFTIFASGPEIDSPNGLLVHDGRLILAGWGRDIQDDFTTKTPGRLLAIDLRSGHRTAITDEPIGNLDGVESDGRGGHIVTDWVTGDILHVDGRGQVRVLFNVSQGAADHAYLPDRHWLILPQMFENKVTAYDLSRRAWD